MQRRALPAASARAVPAAEAGLSAFGNWERGTVGSRAVVPTIGGWGCTALIGRCQGANGIVKDKVELQALVSRWERIATPATLLLGGAGIVLALLVDARQVLPFVPFWLASLFAIVTAQLAATSAHERSVRLGWWIVALSSLVALIATVAILTGLSQPLWMAGSQSLALLVNYGVLALGVLALLCIGHANRHILARLLLDLALMLVGGITIYATVLAGVFGAQLTPADFRNPLLYLPFADAAFVMVLLMGLSAEVTPPRIRRAIPWAVASFTAIGFAHIWIVTAHFDDLPEPRSIVALPYPIGIVLKGMAAVSFLRGAASDAGSPAAAGRHGWVAGAGWRMVFALLPYSISLVGVGLLLMYVGDSNLSIAERVLALVGAVVIFCAGGVRQVLYFADNRDLYRRLLASHRDLEQRVDEQTAVLRRSNRDLETIHQVALVSNRTLDIRSALPDVARQLGETVDADYCRITTLDGATGTFETLAEYRSRAEVQAPSPELLSTLTDDASVAHFQRTTVLTLSEIPPARLERRMLETSGSGAAMLAPLVTAERLVGFIEAYRYEPRAFDRDDIFVAESISAHVSLAIENAAAYERARFAADHDPVTGLMNHRALQERLASELERCRAAGVPFSVAMIDLNNFKEFNDRFGHQTGDEVLRALGSAMAEAAPSGAFVSRYGGDEFTVLMPGYDLQQAGVVIEAIRAKVLAFNERHNTGDLKISLAAGIASYPSDAQTASDLMARADRLMYRDKWRLKGYVERRRQLGATAEPLLIPVDEADPRAAASD